MTETTIDVTHAPGLTLDRVWELITEHTELDANWRDADNQFENLETGQVTAYWERRWTTDNISAVTVAILTEHPGASVEVQTEWDEDGGGGTRYLNVNTHTGPHWVKKWVKDWHLTSTHNGVTGPNNEREGVLP